MQQHSIHMVIGSDAFPQDRRKAPRCATTDQEGVVYLLPLPLSHPGPGDFNLYLSSLRFFLFYLHIMRTYAYLLLSCLVHNAFGRRHSWSVGLSVSLPVCYQSSFSLSATFRPVCSSFFLLRTLHRVLSLLPSLDLDSMY